MSNNLSLKNRLSNLVSKIVERTIAYFFTYLDGSKVQTIVRHNDTLSLGVSAKGKLSVVSVISRTLYSEYRKSYPLTNITELKQVLRQQYNNQLSMHLISAEENHQRQVVSFIFSPELTSQLPGVVCLIPETLLFHAAITSDTVQAELGNQQWFLYKNGHYFSSQIRSGLCKDLSSFALIHGIPENTPQLTVNTSKVAAMLMSGIKRLPLTYWLAAFKLNAVPKAPIPWKGIILTLGSAFAAYFLFVSLYFSITIPQREQEIAASNAVVQSVFTQQQQYEQLQQQQQDIGNILQNQRSVYPVWLVFMHLSDADVSVSAADFVAGELTLSGTAASAVGVLSGLSNLHYVDSAIFSQPTRRSRGQDNFTIRLTFKPEVAHAQ